MDTNLLNKKFDYIGARLKVVEGSTRRRVASAVSLDVRKDRKGEFFEILLRPDATANVEVLDTQLSDRHLLLLVREGSEKNKYLCGHDERHWFVAGLPDFAPVGTVRQAKEALKPREVLTAQAGKRLNSKAGSRRRNAAFVRQGEWFFLPVPRFVADDREVLSNEPLSRGIGSKPHWAEFCYRTGGELVYVCSRHPRGVNQSRYRSILRETPNARNWGWRTMNRNPGVYVRGRIRHMDHATITLQGWHRVVMNTEGQSNAMRAVAFLD